MPIDPKDAPRERPDYDAADVDIQNLRAGKAAVAAEAAALPDGDLEEGDEDAVDSAGDPVEAGRRRAQLKAKSRQAVEQPVRVPHPAPHAPVDPNADVIQDISVDLAVEIPKLMQANGLAPADFNAEIKLTNWEYYRETITSYYRGRDAGYREGYRLAKRSIFFRVRLYLAISAAVSAAVVLWAIVHIIRHLHWG